MQRQDQIQLKEKLDKQAAIRKIQLPLIQIFNDLNRDLLKSAFKKIKDLKFSPELKEILNTPYKNKLLLNEVVRKDKDLNSMTLLLELGANPAKCDDKFESALTIARELKKEEMFHLLSEYEKITFNEALPDNSIITKVKKEPKVEIKAEKEESKDTQSQSAQKDFYKTGSLVFKFQMNKKQEAKLNPTDRLIVKVDNPYKKKKKELEESKVEEQPKTKELPNIEMECRPFKKRR